MTPWEALVQRATELDVDGALSMALGGPPGCVAVRMDALDEAGAGALWAIGWSLPWGYKTVEEYEDWLISRPVRGSTLIDSRGIPTLTALSAEDLITNPVTTDRLRRDRDRCESRKMHIGRVIHVLDQFRDRS